MIVTPFARVVHRTRLIGRLPAQFSEEDRYSGHRVAIFFAHPRGLL